MYVRIVYESGNNKVYIRLTKDAFTWSERTNHKTPLVRHLNVQLLKLYLPCKLVEY